MRSRFAAVRVRPAHRDEGRSTPRPEEWLLIEWPRTEAAPIKYWLSTMPATATCAELVQRSPCCAGGSHATIKN
jgi:SRSO17 transposase